MDKIKDWIKELPENLYVALRDKGMFRKTAVGEDLKILNPQCDKEKLLREYYTQKIRFSLMIIVVGLFIFAMLKIKWAQTSKGMD
ncbi:MAG: hypothetical protein K6F84_02025, partial [Lachnospiraceae bacterium]|nr:hypothetical protein [Lachnospiraceae bacterium]